MRLEDDADGFKPPPTRMVSVTTGPQMLTAGAAQLTIAVP